MKINDLTDLENLEARIRLEFGKHDLDEVLVTIQQNFNNEESFVFAAITLFAIRFSHPPIRKTEKAYQLTPEVFKKIYHLVKTYILSEPATLSTSAKSNYKGSTLIPMLLRLVGNQFNYGIGFWGQYARTLSLFLEIPKKVKSLRNSPKFDIKDAFHKLNQVSIEDFVYTAFVAFTAASNKKLITGGYFQKAKLDGFRLPKDEIIEIILDKIAADQYQMREVYERYKQPNRLYAIYDFNPLFVFPFIRPWIKTSKTLLDEDRLIAPLPNLILYRLSEGIYHQLFDFYREGFSKYFGFLFETYVGEILKNCVETKQIISEEQIRKTYPENKGKVPDWIIIENDTATLIECKATGFNRKSLATGDETAIDNSISQVKKGLIQLHEFKAACEKKTTGLEKLHSVSKFNLRVVTYETFYLINSVIFQDEINPQINRELNKKAIPLMDWRVLSIDELERIQPHTNQGVLFNEIMEMLNNNLFNEVIEKLHKQTNKTFENSFLMKEQEKMFENLGLLELMKLHEEKK